MATQERGSLRARVASEIRAEMGRQKLSQVQLARRMDVAQPWVSRRVAGDVSLSLDELEAFAAGLDVPIARLLGWSEDEGPVHLKSPLHVPLPALAA